MKILLLLPLFLLNLKVLSSTFDYFNILDGLLYETTYMIITYISIVVSIALIFLLRHISISRGLEFNQKPKLNSKDSKIVLAVLAITLLVCAFILEGGLFVHFNMLGSSFLYGKYVLFFVDLVSLIVQSFLVFFIFLSLSQFEEIFSTKNKLIPSIGIYSLLIILVPAILLENFGYFLNFLPLLISGNIIFNIYDRDIESAYIIMLIIFMI